MIELDVEAEDPCWTTALPHVEDLVRQAVQAALEGEGDGAVTVLLTDDASIRELNAQFRDKDKPTNVLSFPAAETARPHIGDIALAFGVCSEEAAAQGKSLAHHLQHLVAHGALHLVGFDHQSDAEAEAMEARERAVLAGLGVSDPYAPVEDR